MKRRDFLHKALVGSAGVAATGMTGCSTSTRQSGSLRGPRVQWRMASSFPSKLDTIYGAAEDMAFRVGEMTDGNFEIQVHEAGELVPALEVMDARQQEREKRKRAAPQAAEVRVVVPKAPSPSFVPEPFAAHGYLGHA